MKNSVIETLSAEFGAPKTAGFGHWRWVVGPRRVVLEDHGDGVSLELVEDAHGARAMVGGFTRAEASDIYKNLSEYLEDIPRCVAFLRGAAI